MKQYFPSLTGFRAIAAWIVFAHHYNPFPGDLFISDVVNEGYIGVTLFFVLSGFLITIRYDDRLSRVTYGQYLRNRFARIYPLFFLLTTLTFLVAVEWDTVRYLACITFMHGFIPGWQFSGISQSWSLTVEETFYFLAPLIFLIIRNSKPGWWLWPIGFLMIGVVIYFRWLDFMLVYTFFGRVFDFFAGVLVAKIFQRRQRTTQDTQFFTWSGIAGILVSITLLAFIRGDHTYGISTAPGLLIHHLLVPAGTALLLWGLITETSFVQRILSTSPMQVLGKSSYAFYLVHLGVIAGWLSGNVSSNLIVLFGLLNGAAVALYYLVERPLRVFVSHGFVSHGKHGIS